MPEHEPAVIMHWKADTPIHHAVMEAMGAASMCWEHPEAAGAFDYERAKAIGDELLALLRAKQWPE